MRYIETTMVVALVTAQKPHTDGNIKIPPGTNRAVAISVEVVRYINMITMYIGAGLVVSGMFMMTPQD